MNLGTVQVGVEGRFTVTIDSTGYRPEQYDLVALTGAPGPPLVARFTVTAGSAPGLPNTGGGGGAVPLTTISLPLAGALVMVGLGLLVSGRCRRGRRPGQP